MYYESATIIELHYTGTVGEVAGEARRMETCGKWPRSHYKSVLSKPAGKEMLAGLEPYQRVATRKMQGRRRTAQNLGQI